MRFAPEARPFVLPVAGLAGLLLLLGKRGWGAATAALAGGVLLFFRDPDRRHSHHGDDLLLSPAEGLVTRVDETFTDAEIGPGQFRRVVIFLSVFDVHVQRVPVSGEVVFSGLTTGQKVAAFRADADTVNEKHLTVIRTAAGHRVGVRQITGLIARRIVCYLHAGQQVDRGQHLGLIRFGSRVDLIVPAAYETLVAKGDRVRVGETPIFRAVATATGEAVATPADGADDLSPS